MTQTQSSEQHEVKGRFSSIIWLCTAFEVSKGDQACPVNEILLLR